MRSLILGLVLSVLPITALADRVAVLPVQYFVVWENAPSVDKAALIRQKIVDAIARAQLTTIEGEPLTRALDEVTDHRPDTCRDKSCLSSLADELDADEVIYLSVEESGAKYTIKLVLARGATTTGELFGPFSAAQAKVRELVETALTPPEEAPIAPPIEPPLEPPPPTPASPLETTPPTAKPIALGTTDEPAPEQGLSPVAFYLSAGVTVALGAAFAVTDIRVTRTYRDCKPRGSCKTSVIEAAETLQVVDWFLAGGFAAAAVTTGVLFFLTDFNGSNRADEDTSSRTAVTPAMTENAGMIVVHGRF